MERIGIGVFVDATTDRSLILSAAFFRL